MTEIDLSRLPTGARGWSALVEWAAASDDRQERYFLELKSDIDLNGKRGRHKVAKFVLGAANRDPAKAAKRFGGHAVMLLGVSPGAISGIAAFEAKDLEREVSKLTGADGPGWDFERIRVDDEHDVIAIIADPPTARIWPCLADGEGVCNGDIYLRGDGNTEKAKGVEVQSMLTRLMASGEDPKLPEITVAIEGSVMGVQFDPKRVVSWVEDANDDYLRGIGSDRVGGPFGLLASQGLIEQRSETNFRRQIERWTTAAMADPASGLHDLAARIAVGIRVRVTNPEMRSLRDVRVDIEFDEPVRALDWEDPERDDRAELFPDRPPEWGRDSLAYILRDTHIAPFVPRDTDGLLQISQISPAKLSLSLNLLRSKEARITEEDDIVLVLFVEDESPEQLTARWKLTAGDVHDLREGTLVVPLAHYDWRGPLASLLSDDDAQPDEGAV
ncbi:hypothetical protein [Microbacterium rhizomatis]|uniref:Uncharacterized protein n=1 Tax=Microbacterium rhizomatis TaxID=1631477 RepID=A0A5J5IYZ0_9MICO|nr:hypothetical protein [Microbacterium rhizomatis]KAA9105510.1 hypothetical protein F6B43_17185 [Microbacterium rhizomatis]